MLENISKKKKSHAFHKKQSRRWKEYKLHKVILLITQNNDRFPGNEETH